MKIHFSVMAVVAALVAHPGEWLRLVPGAIILPPAGRLLRRDCDQTNPHDQLYAEPGGNPERIVPHCASGSQECAKSRRSLDVRDKWPEHDFQ